MPPLLPGFVVVVPPLPPGAGPGFGWVMPPPAPRGLRIDKRRDCVVDPVVEVCGTGLRIRMLSLPDELRDGILTTGGGVVG